jgi:NAD(P)-dependent dehydrogenase (short-subunit alcohol dehydrogenase family)
MAGVNEPATRFAVVTGAASGIGAATLELHVERGWRVAALDIDAARLEASVRRVNAQASGAPAPRATAVVADVADEAQVVGAFAAIDALSPAIDALATSAGVADMTPFMDLSVAAFRRVHDVNVIGTWLCMREAARRMRPGARICTVASVAGIRGGGLSGTAAYAASKGAVLALTKNAARALAERGISVNTVAPGATDTPMIEEVMRNASHRERIESMSVQHRIADAAEIARAIAFLLSADASIVTGATLVADGGLTMY